MKVSELYECCPAIIGQDVYIIGTGPSLRVFPIEHLRGRTCILLNNAHRILPDLGPIAFSNHARFLEKDNCQCEYQIVKGRLKYLDDPPPTATDNHVPWDDPKYYVFSYREPRIRSKVQVYETGDQWSHHDDRALWAEPDFYWNMRGGTVAIFAVQFAALAGAKSISLVGCDCCEFVGKNGDHEKPLPLKCASRKARGPDSMQHEYDQYAAGLDRLVRECWQRLKVPVIHLSPFPGFGREQQQFREFQTWGDSGWI